MNQPSDIEKEVERRMAFKNLEQAKKTRDRAATTLATAQERYNTAAKAVIDAQDKIIELTPEA